MTQSTNLPASQSTNTCTYCDQPAVDGGYIQPPMCTQHHALAILISLLKSHGQIASLENIRTLAVFFPRAGLQPDDVPALLQPMREEVPG